MAGGPPPNAADEEEEDEIARLFRPAHDLIHLRFQDLANVPAVSDLSLATFRDPGHDAQLARHERVAILDRGERDPGLSDVSVFSTKVE